MSSFKTPYELTELIDLNQSSLWIAIAAIIFNPLYWNIVARREYKTKFLTRLAFNTPLYACYTLAFTIFTLGLLRDHLYREALVDQPTLSLLGTDEFKFLAGTCFGLGGVLVVSSMWALGITGTYLGDYSGIYMEKKVETFPFNVTDNPMYYGSTLSFLGTAIWYQSPAGLLLTILVFVEYKIALLFEEPFTANIYAQRDLARAASKSSKSTSNGNGNGNGVVSGTPRSSALKTPGTPTRRSTRISGVDSIPGARLEL